MKFICAKVIHIIYHWIRLFVLYRVVVKIDTCVYITPQVKMLDSDWWRAGQHVICHVLPVNI